jgi:hypothetical protein
VRARIELVARGTVTVEIDESQKERIEEEVFGPMDLDDFERLTGLNLDTSNIFGTSHMEVDDVEFLSDTKSQEVSSDTSPEED